MSIEQVLTGGGGGLIIGLLTLWAKWQFDKRQAQTSITEQQRLAFEAVIKPTQDEVVSLRTRMTAVEENLRQERDLRERVLNYARALYWAWARKFPDDPPPVAPESIQDFFN